MWRWDETPDGARERMVAAARDRAARKGLRGIGDGPLGRDNDDGESSDSDGGDGGRGGNGAAADGEGGREWKGEGVKKKVKLKESAGSAAGGREVGGGRGGGSAQNRS